MKRTPKNTSGSHASAHMCGTSRQKQGGKRNNSGSAFTAHQRQSVPPTMQKCTTNYAKEAHDAINKPRRAVQLSHLLMRWCHGKNRMSKHVHTKLGLLIRDIAWSRHRFRLPARLLIPFMPSQCSNHLPLLRELFASIIHDMPVPPLIKDYLRQAILFVGKRTSSVRQYLCTTRIKRDWGSLTEQSQHACQCHTLPTHIPRVHGCVVARSAQHIQTVLPTYHKYINQNLGNAIIGDSDTYTQQASKSICQLARTFPGFTVAIHCTVTTEFLAP